MRRNGTILAIIALLVGAVLAIPAFAKLVGAVVLIVINGGGHRRAATRETAATTRAKRVLPDGVELFAHVGHVLA